MTFDLRYHPKVEAEDIPKLSRDTQLRIRRAIETKLVGAPERYATPLRGSLRHYWKLRVGDYRVIFALEAPTIWILGIIHRRDVYERIERRAR